MKKDGQRDHPAVMDKLTDRFRHKYWELPRPSSPSNVESVARSSAAAAIARFRSVLVLLDGSEHAEHAIPIALEIADRSDADLQLAHVQLALGCTYDGHSHSFEEASGFQSTCVASRRRPGAPSPSSNPSAILPDRDRRESSRVAPTRPLGTNDRTAARRCSKGRTAREDHAKERPFWRRRAPH